MSSSQHRIHNWLLVAAVVAMLPLSAWAFLVTLRSDGPEWQMFLDASRRFTEGGLYAETATYAFRWHPLAAWAFGPLSVIGFTGWRLLHVLAAFAMPSWPLRLLTLACWPFWWDTEAGNIMAFVVLAGAWALNGSRVGMWAFLVLAVIAPRPLMLPLAAWIVWRHPAMRIPAIGIMVVGLASALATGWAPDWFGRLIASSNEIDSVWNLGPSRLVGAAWLIVGVPLAAWLTIRGRAGIAGLAMSPYILPSYPLILLWEWSAGRSPSGSSLFWHRGRSFRSSASASSGAARPLHS